MDKDNAVEFTTEQYLHPETLTQAQAVAMCNTLRESLDFMQARVQYLLDNFVIKPTDAGHFTFPDGDTWYKSKETDGKIQE